jgi:hypothetical protein
MPIENIKIFLAQITFDDGIGVQYLMKKMKEWNCPRSL